MEIVTPKWVREAVFYQIFPDRFAKSSRVNKTGLNLEPWNAPPTSHSFKGGDLLGIVEHMDYLKDLGINALYLNPVFTSASNHRYHTYDYYNVDPLLGGNDALRELLEEAHKREIHVVLDGVFNHASRGFYQFQQTLENGAGSPYVDWFHFSKKMLERKIPFGAYPHPEQQALLDSGKSSLDILGYRAWYNLPALPKFNTDTQAVREFLWGVAEYWIKFGIDGWRIDVAKEIDDDSFYQEFRSRVKALNPDAYIVGELWEESQRWLQGDQFDAAMNYLLTAAVMGFFIKDMDHQIFDAGEFNKYLHSLNAEEFADRIEYLLEIYDPAINGVMLNSLDSHDTPRFITTARNDQSAYDMATLFLFTFPGAPCLYYGDEIGLDGKNDPECRKTFLWEKDLWDNERLNFTKSCINLRKSHLALSTGSFKFVFAQDECVVFTRQKGDDTLLVGFNVSEQQKIIEIRISGEQTDSGWLEALIGKGSAFAKNGKVSLNIPARSGTVMAIH
jgi:neopullulanase